MKRALFAVLLMGTSVMLQAQSRSVRYALLLQDPPLAREISNTKDLKSAAATDRRARIESAQRGLSQILQSRGVRVLGSNQILLNAVYVQATEYQVDSLRALPGVAKVVELPPIKRKLNAALDLINAKAAWNTLGGMSNAGTGVKIAILDTGIDQTHPGFQDPSLSVPSGYPKCNSGNGECAYTNNKVIAARSYVNSLNFAFGQDPADTRPDDFSPRDRVGHGTAAAMIAAGVTNNGPIASITGVAPKAWLGNYKIYGSPGVNDVTFSNVVNQALEDALNDGMDIAVLSLSTPALCGPNTSKDICGDDVDVRVPVIENAIRMGLTVITSAGDEGSLGTAYPDGSITSPGTSPSAITVGGTYNGHIHFQTASASGSGLPSSLQTIDGYFSDAPRPDAPLTAPLRDAAKAGDAYACSALTANSLQGAIALVQRGNCTSLTKVVNAQNAGAVAVLLYLDTGNFPFRPTGVQNGGIPMMLIGNTAGTSLRDALNAGTAVNITLDPAFREVQDPDVDRVAFESSKGPSIGENAIKPELVAPSTGIYTATQNYDPNGDLYHSSRYVSVNGTDFAAALVGGAAALVKQKNPNFSPAQIKSALVNTANNNVSDVNSNGQAIRASIMSVGAGKLDAAAALNTQVTVEPATLSFGVVDTSLPSRNLTFRNSGTASVNVRLTVQATNTDSRAQVQLSNSQFSISAGQSVQVTARLSGSQPAAGDYEGYIVADTGQQQLKIPFLYMVGDGVPASLLPLAGYEFVSEAGGPFFTPLRLRVTDQWGVPVAGAPVRFQPTTGGGTISVAGSTTDELGIAYANVMIKNPGDQAFSVTVGSLPYTFYGTGRPKPNVPTDRVVDAASGVAGPGIVAGSYITLGGTYLADSVRLSNTAYLPLSLSGASVSFDVPAKGISVPGRLTYASPTQVNVQVPWELQGAGTVSMKLSVGDSSSAVLQVPIVDAAPSPYLLSGTNPPIAIAQDFNQGNRLITTSTPIAAGSVAQIYVNGLGAVDNQPASGEAASATNLSRTRIQPTVTIGGQNAQVLFSGLVPGTIGLYQINVVVPSGIPSGVQPLVITSNGVTSKQSNLPIQ